MSLIRDVIRPELERSEVRLHIDARGNLIATLKGRGRAERLVLVSYAMNAAPSTMHNPYSGAVVDGAPYGIEGECVWGQGSVRAKGEPGGDDGGGKVRRRMPRRFIKAYSEGQGCQS